MRSVTLGEILEPVDERLGSRPEPTILTLTEKLGFVSQHVRFKKRVATEDTSAYRVVHRYDIAFNPYLLWAGAIAQNTNWEEAIISPVYPTFKIRRGFDPRFVNYRIHSEAMRLRYESISFGAVPRRRRAATQRFLELDAGFFPPLSEQRRIASVLDKANAIRGKRHQSRRLAGRFMRSVFIDMFGDPASKSRRWPAAKVMELGKVVTGNTPSRAQPQFFGNEIEWIKTDNISAADYFLTAAAEGLSQEGKRLSRFVPAGSTLVTCIAGSPESIGNSAFADREVAFNQQINAVIPASDVEPFFLLGLLRASKKLIQAASTASMKGMVSKSRFESIELINPPPELQRRYARTFAKYLEIFSRQTAALHLSEEAFAALCQRAFRGKL